MTNTLTISRELAERLTSPLINPEDFNFRIGARAELRAMLAAPVVERQDDECVMQNRFSALATMAVCPVPASQTPGN